MGIALFTVSSLFVPLQAWANRLAPIKTRSKPLHQRLTGGSDIACAPPAGVASGSVSGKANASADQRRHGGSEPVARRSRSLRVVRTVESDIPAGRCGRMVISGRMADVCAELERLAALEARLPNAAR